MVGTHTTKYRYEAYQPLVHAVPISGIPFIQYHSHDYTPPLGCIAVFRRSRANMNRSHDIRFAFLNSLNSRLSPSWSLEHQCYNSSLMILLPDCFHSLVSIFFSVFPRRNLLCLRSRTDMGSVPTTPPQHNAIYIMVSSS